MPINPIVVPNISEQLIRPDGTATREFAFFLEALANRVKTMPVIAPSSGGTAADDKLNELLGYMRNNGLVDE